jgi:hypothetical protein
MDLCLAPSGTRLWIRSRRQRRSRPAHGTDRPIVAASSLRLVTALVASDNETKSSCSSDYGGWMGPDDLCGLLAEPSRLRTYAAVVLDVSMPADIARLAGLEPPVVFKALQRLEKGGLITSGPHGFHTEPRVFKDAVRSTRPDPADRVPLDEDPARDQVLKAFVSDGRLTVIPTVPAKLQVVLEHLARAFEPGRDYLEKEVNGMLNEWYPDHAALRRHLVEAGLLTRADGIYRRVTETRTQG